MGGASARAFNVVKGLVASGCQIELIAAVPHYPLGKIPAKYRRKAIIPELVDGTKLLRVWMPSLPHSNVINRCFLHLCFIVSCLFALPWISKVDVIWAANPNLFCSFPAMLYGLITRKPVVRNVDDLWPEVFYEMNIVKSRVFRATLDFLAKLSYTLPLAITPVSAGYKTIIIKKYGVDPKKIRVIEVGVEPPEYSRSDMKMGNKFNIMYSGVIGPGYDFDIVLHAADVLRKQEDIVFIIRGMGELAPRLEKRFAAFHPRNVILELGFLPKTKLSLALQTADAFVLPMAHANVIDAGLPTKVFEYQAYGKPIICISAGEAAKYIEASDSGLIVKPGDIKDLAEAAIRLCMDRKYAAELGMNGRRYVLNYMTSEKIGERMHAVLASVAHPDT
jgi:glycosyltransferase involved in cell wall biosynthesis